MGFKSFVDNLKGSKPKPAVQGSTPYINNTADSTTQHRPLNKKRSFFRSHNDLPQSTLRPSRSEIFKRSEIDIVAVDPFDDTSLTSHAPATAPLILDGDDSDGSIRYTPSERRPSLSKIIRRSMSVGLFSSPAPDDSLPPMPAIPAAYANQTAKSIRKPKPAPISTSQSRSKFFWASSNPDYDSMPPTPALIRDSTPSPRSVSSFSASRKSSIVSPREPRYRHSRSMSSTFTCKTDDGSRDSFLDPAITATFPAVPPRPANTYYVPRNAARGFLSSTTAVSDATRKSWRQSSMCSTRRLGGDTMMCLSDEQVREWERLKGVMNAAEGRDTHLTEEDESIRLAESVAALHRQVAHDRALAALESNAAH